MKAKIETYKEVELTTLSVKAGVRYWEDATVNGVKDKEGNLIPCRIDDYWCPEIDIETGKITNWEQGKTAKVHYKVCDDGTYQLKDKKGNVVLEIDGYVPVFLDTGRDGYGDYIILDINENGQIAGWNNNPDISDFQNEEDNQ